MRVVSLAGVIACCAAAAFVWQAKRPSPPVEETLRKPWIGLPPIVMDAGSSDTRHVLRLAAQSETDLVHRCNYWDEANATEKYVAYLGDDRRSWRIELDVHDDRIHAFVAESIFPPPPPPPPPGCHYCTSIPPAPVKTSSMWFDKAELEPIAQAWRDSRLWAAPQAGSRCVDGISAFLEARVAGRYAAFDRNCDGEGMNAAWDLWGVMQRLLPAPQ